MLHAIGRSPNGSILRETKTTFVPCTTDSPNLLYYVIGIPLGDIPMHFPKTKRLPQVRYSKTTYYSFWLILSGDLRMVETLHIDPSPGSLSIESTPIHFLL